MIALLKIVAIVAIVAILVVVGVVLFVLRWVRKVVKSAAASSTGASCPPCRVNPEPEPAPQWRTPEKIQKFAGEFKALGFEEVGAFTIPEMGGLQMLAFVHPGEQLYGTIYDHKKIAPTFDIFCTFDNETGLTASSSKAGRSLDKRPGNPILWVGDERVATVLEALKKEPQAAPKLEVAAEIFLPLFKRNYAAGMNWRMKKGGVSRGEIRRQAESSGKTLSEEALNEAYKNLRKAHVVELQRGCLAQFLDDQKMSASDWKPMQDRAVVIPGTLETDELIEALEGGLDLDQEQRHALSQIRRNNGETALDVIDEIMSGNVAALELEKYGEVQEPVHAYVLLTPAKERSPELSVCS